MSADDKEQERESLNKIWVSTIVREKREEKRKEDCCIEDGRWEFRPYLLHTRSLIGSNAKQGRGVYSTQGFQGMTLTEKTEGIVVSAIHRLCRVHDHLGAYIDASDKLAV